MKIAFVTDSGIGKTAAEMAADDIISLPLQISVDGRSLQAVSYTHLDAGELGAVSGSGGRPAAAGSGVYDACPAHLRAGQFRHGPARDLRRLPASAAAAQPSGFKR